MASLGAVQLDAVNVLVRSHYLTVYSRLGPYPRRLLDEQLDPDRAAFEYWGHAASLIPVEFHPALRWRMTSNAEHKNWLAFQERVERERPGYLAAVEREVAERGPIRFGELSDPARRDRSDTKYAASSVLWERFSDGKSVLEGLFNAGRLSASGRRGFERLYDLTERVIPAEILAQPTPPADEAQRFLVQHAVRALGVATARDVADYYRLPAVVTRARLRELVDGGELRPAVVQGWNEPAYLDPGADTRPVEARALLSPFDSLLWERSRVERLFGFRHSFELYVKPAKREYGYFVLPFLLGERLVARVDLSADRNQGILQVLGAYAEPSVRPRTIAADLSTELNTLATWLDLEKTTVTPRGNLAPHL
ncbi:winged helix-turn-helix domain-containing protein [Kribbella pittospori]|uniref:winged helix-turn-helix domain-containing protein n=1 Tax=Kribbella pittospori TaxID=722689 RepID=UPI001EDFDD05|nr:crosslink repair DNA glycosylase YcaQ family protein [Kribbella pittospori]